MIDKPMCEHCSLKCIASGCECLCHSKEETKSIHIGKDLDLGLIITKAKLGIKEWNLAEQRKELRRYLEMYKHQIGEGIICEIMCKINEQDKEFIKRLKEELHNNEFETEVYQQPETIIDKLSGDIK